MKKKLGKKLIFMKQTISNLSEQEMTNPKGGAHTTLAGPQCDTNGNLCTRLGDCTIVYTMAPIICG